jgi:hypothetical protein
MGSSSMPIWRYERHALATDASHLRSMRAHQNQLHPGTASATQPHRIVEQLERWHWQSYCRPGRQEDLCLQFCTGRYRLIQRRSCRTADQLFHSGRQQAAPSSQPAIRSTRSRSWLRGRSSSETTAVRPRVRHRHRRSQHLRRQRSPVGGDEPSGTRLARRERYHLPRAATRPARKIPAHRTPASRRACQDEDSCPKSLEIRTIERMSMGAWLLHPCLPRRRPPVRRRRRRQAGHRGRESTAGAGAG